MGWAGVAADAWVLCQPRPAGPLSWPKGGSSRELWLLPPRRLRLSCGGRTELGRRIRRTLRALVGCELGIPFEVLPLTSRETSCESVFAFDLGFHVYKMELQ